MAADIVDLAARRPAVAEEIRTGVPIFDELMQQVVNSPDVVVAALWLTSVFAGVARGAGVPVDEIAALAAGEVQLDTLARRHAGLLARWADEELARQAMSDEAG